MDEIAVLIICYNEAIQKVVTDFKHTLTHAKKYGYNNDSSNETAKLAEKVGAIVRNEYRSGKGNVIRRIFRDIDARCYIMVDGDDTYPAETAPEMAKKYLKETQIWSSEVGCYQHILLKTKDPFINIGNSVVRTSINMIFRTDINYIMTGYRAFSYRFVKTCSWKICDRL